MAPTLPRAATRAASLIATTPVAAPTLGLGLGLARPATTTTTLLPLRAAATPTTLAAALARRTYATPAGQPPSRHFRPPPETTWENDKSSLLDRAGKYFLMTEIARGMYILLEQFFRPPWVWSLSLRAISSSAWGEGNVGSGGWGGRLHGPRFGLVYTRD
jgi:hypothetical protein